MRSPSSNAARQYYRSQSREQLDYSESLLQRSYPIEEFQWNSTSNLPETLNFKCPLSAVIVNDFSRNSMPNWLRSVTSGIFIVAVAAEFSPEPSLHVEFFMCGSVMSPWLM